MNTFAKTLHGLGYANYEAYLRSEHWKSFHTRYRNAGLPMECAVCGGGFVELHHHTYERLGAELPTDVTPLCPVHHKAVHKWLEDTGKCLVKFTDQAVRALGGGAQQKQSAMPKAMSRKTWKKAQKRKSGNAARRLSNEIMKSNPHFTL